MVIWLGLVLVLLLLTMAGVDLDGLLEALLAALALAVLTGFVPSTALVAQFVLFVVLGLLLFAALRIGRKPQPGGGNTDHGLGTAVVLSAEPQPERWRVRWRGQSWAALNSDPTIPLQVDEEVFVVEHQGTCLQVISKRSLLASD
ncbi:NfeD family protein [Candidatus Synechococcus spongiarum]|uniref:Activity regulator of membrane protease YbbK n=1 Tax=Candidatus Synechococcus spongiarum TaxID=431041 RepID=A0A161KFH7_9SYNE|nr:NfeD family protein [Candidatus Synechococcus spongiarum]CZB15970.1 hypothetical protein FLM9_678 [Candidatus Synechococcus spongiarum]